MLPPVSAAFAWPTIVVGALVASVMLGMGAYLSARRTDWPYAPLLRVAAALAPLGFVTWWLWQTRWRHHAKQ